MIRQHTKKDGKTRYTATARITIAGQKYSDTKTFNTEALAKKWIPKRKKEFMEMHRSGISAGHKGLLDASKISVPDLIKAYIEKMDSERNLSIGRSKRMALESMIASPFFLKMKACNLTEDKIIEYAEYRNKQAKPQTVAQDISYLRQPYKKAKSLLKIDLIDIEFDKALKDLNDRKLVDKSVARTRKASPSELKSALEHLKETKKRRKIPTDEIVEFAYESCMRLSEICSIKWSDLNEDDMTIMIRKRKDPSNKHRNDQNVPITRRALEIIKLQTKKDSKIFPYKSDSVRTSWEKACNRLEIDDLHFHDLRRTGLTRLVESGLSLEEAMVISGHKDYQMLLRYINMNPKQVATKLSTLNLVNAI